MMPCIGPSLALREDSRAPSGSIGIANAMGDVAPAEPGLTAFLSLLVLVAGLATGALQAAVFRASAARRNDSLAQCLARTEHAHRGVAVRDALFVGKCPHFRAVDFDTLQRCSVFGLQRLSQARDTLADFAPDLVRRLCELLQLRREQSEPSMG